MADKQMDAPLNEVIAEVRRLRKLADESSFGDFGPETFRQWVESEGDVNGRDVEFAAFAANHIMRLCDALETYMEACGEECEL